MINALFVLYRMWIRHTSFTFSFTSKRQILRHHLRRGWVFQLVLRLESRVLRSSTLVYDCQHSLHRQTLLLVSSAAIQPFGTVFLHLYALLTLKLVLGLSSRPTCSQDICSRSTVRASDTLMSVFRAL